MARRVHLVAGVLATMIIAAFFISSILVELFGSSQHIQQVKALIVVPGLLLLVPAIAATGGSGFYLGRTRKGRLVNVKRKRMPFIAANGILVLVPSAIFLNRWAASGQFGASFYVLQVIELAAGAINLTLMGLNIRDGMRMSGRFRQSA